MGHVLSWRDCSSLGMRDVEHLPGEAVLSLCQALCPDGTELVGPEQGSVASGMVLQVLMKS